MNKRGNNKSRVVTLSLTLSCQQPRGAGGAGSRDVLLSLPPSQHFRASQPARRLQTRSPYQSGSLTSLRQVSKPSRFSLCFREKMANNSLSSKKEDVSVMQTSKNARAHRDVSEHTTLGPPGSRGRGFLPMLNKARIQSFIITLFEYSPKEYLSLESAKCGCWLTLESRAVLPCPSRQS